MNKMHNILKSEHFALHRTCLQNFSLCVSPLFCVIIHVMFFVGAWMWPHSKKPSQSSVRCMHFSIYIVGALLMLCPILYGYLVHHFCCPSFSPSSLTREIILVDVYLIFTQLSFYLPSHYTPQIQAEEITLD